VGGRGREGRTGSTDHAFTPLPLTPTRTTHTTHPVNRNRPPTPIPIDMIPCGGAGSDEPRACSLEHGSPDVEVASVIISTRSLLAWNGAEDSRTSASHARRAEVHVRRKRLAANHPSGERVTQKSGLVLSPLRCFAQVVSTVWEAITRARTV